MRVKTIKMHGQGNDYIFFDLEDTRYDSKINWCDWAIRLSDRHFGIGGDGLVLIENPDGITRMRIFNSDGSEATTCGTALRCTARYLSQKHHIDKIDIHTLSGVKPCTIHPDNAVTVNMGKAQIINEKSIQIHGHQISGTLINIGNPHFCIIDDKALTDNDKLFELTEKQVIPPDGVNVENISICDDSHIKIKIWERGSGFTLACGSGACASAFLLNKSPHLWKGRTGSARTPDTIKVSMPGGDVTVQILSDDTCLLTGKIETIFTTEMEI